jgi:hypothetical protein
LANVLDRGAFYLLLIGGSATGFVGSDGFSMRLMRACLRRGSASICVELRVRPSAGFPASFGISVFLGWIKAVKAAMTAQKAEDSAAQAFSCSWRKTNHLGREAGAAEKYPAAGAGQVHSLQATGGYQRLKRVTLSPASLSTWCAISGLYS